MRDLSVLAVLLLLASAAAAFSGWQALVAESMSTRAMLGGLALLLAFLIGLACGERSKSAYCRRIVLANRQLGDQNCELLEVNATLLQKVAGRHDDASQPQSVPEQSLESCD